MKEKETITQPLESISTGKMIVEFYCYDRKGFLLCHLSSTGAWKSSDCETKENTVTAGKMMDRAAMDPQWV
jgi:hypothetical protein